MNIWTDIHFAFLPPFFGLANRSDLPNRVATSLQEPRSEPGGAMQTRDSNSNPVEPRPGGRKSTVDQSGSDGRRCQLGHMGPQKASWPTLEIDRTVGIRDSVFFDFPVTFNVFCWNAWAIFLVSAWQVRKLVNIRHWRPWFWCNCVSIWYIYI